MKRTAIRITIDDAVLAWIDQEIVSKRFRSASHAFEFAMNEIMKER